MQHSTAQSNAALVRQLAAWLNGIDYEIDFWDSWLAKQGGAWSDDFTGRMNPDRLVDPDLFEGMDISNTQKVLDVGAGPVSYFGYKLNGQPIDLCACDPLAPQYAAMSSRYEIAWPVKTESAFAEDLSAFYPRSHFDMVVCRNALDHSFDPVRGIEEMLLVLRTGGRANLMHYVNEAEHGHYDGFHQWNFDVVDGKPVVWNKSANVDLIERFGDCADVHYEKKDRWVNFRFDKKRDPALAENRALLRIAELLLATRDAFLLNPGKPAKRESREGRNFVITYKNLPDAPAES